MKLALNVNGTRKEVDVDDDMPLVWILRDSLGMTGTKFGCGVGVCGSCTVLENGKAIRSCQLPASEAKDRSFTTIEGLSADGTHPCQRAWLEEDVAQCGYCQPGMILEAVALLQVTRAPTDGDIDRVFAPHVCRCGTYIRIRRAVHRAAAEQA